MGLFDYLRESFGNPIRRIVRDIQDDVTDAVMSKIQVLQRHIMKQMASMMIIILAGLFLALAAVFFFIEYVQVTKTLAFFILGIILLCIGLMIKFIT